MKMTTALFIAGLILESAGFLLASTDHIPFLLRLVSPKYVGAKGATEVLRDGGSVAQGDAGFETLAQFAMDRLSEIEKNPPEAIASIHVLSFTRTGGTGIAFGKRGVTERVVVQVKLSNGQEVPWNLVEIEGKVSELQETRLFWWGVGLFSLGILLQLIGFFFKPPTPWKDL